MPEINELNNNEIAIIVKTSVEEESELLLSIIKDCLERDYVFRTRFNGKKIILDYEKVEDAVKNNSN